MKTIQQIKDCQAIELGYNSFADLVLHPKKDMKMNHINWCIERSMQEYAEQEINPIIEFLKDISYNLDKELKNQADEFLEEIKR